MKYGYFNHGDLIPTIDSFTVGAYILVVCSPTDYISKAVTLEDLGWTVRDCIKVLLQDKTLQVGLFRKPFKGTVANNVLTNGCGGLNIGISRITHNEIIKETTRKGRVDGKAIVFNDKSCGFDNTKNIIASASPLGRFPANLILECTCEKVIEGNSDGVVINTKNSKSVNDTIYKLGHSKGEQEAPRAYKDTGATHTDSNCPCKKLDKQSGDKSGTRIGNPNELIKKKGNKLFGGVQQETESEGHCYRDVGGASRYFKTFETISGLKIYLRKMIDPDYENI